MSQRLLGSWIHRQPGRCADNRRRKIAQVFNSIDHLAAERQPAKTLPARLPYLSIVRQSFRLENFAVGTFCIRVSNHLTANGLSLRPLRVRLCDLCVLRFFELPSRILKRRVRRGLRRARRENHDSFKANNHDLYNQLRTEN